MVHRGQRYLLGVAVGSCLAAGCAKAAGDPRLDTAESVISSFYAFDSTRVDSLLRTAGDARARILAYQGWANGGNYTVERREPCRLEPTATVVCAVTVRDDIVRSLQLDLWVTDTFRFSFADGVVSSVATSSNDPPVVGAAFKWVQENRPELYSATGVCSDSAGPNRNPRECARAVMVAFREYRARPTP